MADWRINAAIVILAFLYVSVQFSWFVLTFTLIFVGLACGVALGLLNGPPGGVRRRGTYTLATTGDKTHAAIVQVKQYPSPTMVPLLFSRTLDSRLQEILDMTFKHHISPFYRQFGKDSEKYYRSFQPEMWTVLAALRDRIVKINMLQLMSQDSVQTMMDYFQYQRQFISHPSGVLETGEPDPSSLPMFEPDLEMFPYLASPEAERDFLQKVCDVVFCATLPRNVLNCSGVRCLVREFVVSHLLLPTVERLCDPDFVNQYLLLYLEQKEKGAKKAKTKYAKAATYESFMKYLQNCKSIDELQHTRELILIDIIQARAVVKMKSERVQTGSLRGPDIPIPAEKAEKLRSRNLQAYINQLTNARTACEKQLRKLGGPDYVSTAHAYPSTSSTSVSSRVSFDHIMASQELRSIFNKFLKTLSAAHLLECWERIEAIRELCSEEHKDALEALHDTYLAPWAPKYVDADPKLVAGCKPRISNGDAGLECLVAAVEVQKQLRLQLHAQFYNSFLTSPEYLEFRKASPQSVTSDEQQGSSLPEGPHRSSDSPVFFEQTLPEEGRHEKRLRGLRQDLADTMSSLKDIPLSEVSPAAAQRKQALERKQKLIVSELHELENYMERTEDWFGAMGEWCVHVSAVDISSEGGTSDPAFMLIVGQSMAALKAEDVHHFDEAFEHIPSVIASTDGAQLSINSELDGGPSPHDERSRSNSAVDSDTSTSESAFPTSEGFEGASIAHESFRDGWVVQRKLSEFKSLHAKLSQIDSSLSLPLPLRPKFSLPRLASSPTVPIGEWQKYCSQLSEYLGHVLGREVLQSCEEVFLFLSPPYQMVMKADASEEAVKKTSILPSSLKELLTNTKVESLVDPLFSLLVEIFELGEWKMLFRKQLMDLMQFAFGVDFDRQVQETIAWYVSEPMLICYLEGARDILWPNGAPRVNTAPRTAEEKQATKERAREKLLKNPPVLLQSIVGSKNCQIGLEKIFMSFQNPKANKQLFYAMLEVLLRAVVPELEDMAEFTDSPDTVH